MPRLLQGLLLTLAALCVVSCDSEPVSQEPLDFAAEPTDELETMVQETPSDFTFGFLEDNVLLRLRSDRDWEGSLVLAGFQIANGDVVDRLTTAPVQTSDDELAGGLLTEDVFSASGAGWSTAKTAWEIDFNVIDEEWGGRRTRKAQPRGLWIPDQSWMPSEVEQAVMANTDLAPDETLYVLYVRLEDQSTETEQTTRPFGVILPQTDGS